VYVATHKSNGYVYVYLQECHLEGGKPKTRVVKKLGRLDKLLAENPRALEELKAKAELMSREKQTAQAAATFREVMSADNERLFAGRGFPCLRYGHYAVRHILGELGFDDLLNRLKRTYKPKYPVVDITRHLVAVKVLDPSSHLQAHEQADRLWLGDPLKGAALQHMYYTLAFLHNHKAAIMRSINRVVGKKVDRSYRMAFFDVTNCFFETPYDDREWAAIRADRKGEDVQEGEPLRMRGKSKEHRSDLPLVQIALVIDEYGIPVDFEIFPGNCSEFKMFLPEAERLCKTYKIKEIIMMADRGINSLKNLDGLVKKGFGFIVAQKVSNLPPELEAKMMDLASYKAVSPDMSIQSCPYKKTGTRKNDPEVDCTIVFSYSKKREKRDLACLEALVGKAERAIAEHRNMPGTQSGWAELVVGDQGKKPKAKMLDEKIIAARKARAGFSGIIYRDPGNAEKKLTTEEVLGAYQRQVRIEECFRIMKSNFDLRPMYVWTKESIGGHVLVCVLALIALRFIQMAAAKTCDLSLMQIADTLKSAELTVIPARSQTEPWCYENHWHDLGYERSEEPSALQKIMSACGLEPLPNFTTREGLSQCLRTRFASEREAVGPHWFDTIEKAQQALSGQAKIK